MQRRKNPYPSKQSELELKALERPLLCFQFVVLKNAQALLAPFLYEGADGADAA